MPGPKMGPRPPDFDESIIRQSPTFAKWEKLEHGEKLRYACREFVKGHGDDQERLMRRIMIARRNNIRDHETLKKARRQTRGGDPTGELAGNELPVAVADPLPPMETIADEGGRRRRAPISYSDQEVEKEMDISAVEATRSYRAWMALTDGQEFLYNQKYIKGREGHDWLLRKNIWRRMRYRRENKTMVKRLRESSGQAEKPAFTSKLDRIQDAAGPSAAAMEDSNQPAKTTIADENGYCQTDSPIKPHLESPTTNDLPALTSITAPAIMIKVETETDVHDAATQTAAAAAASSDAHLTDEAAIEAAVAAAVDFSKTSGLEAFSVVHNPLDTASLAQAALDAAARLAAATTGHDLTVTEIV